MSLYFILLIFTISFPLAASWDSRFKYFSKIKALIPAFTLTAIFFIPWDIFFTKNKIWGFNKIHISNINFFDMPIEEWLFFFVIPYSCLFIYESVKYFFDLKKINDFSRKLFLIIAILLLVVAAMNPNKSYTFWNFLFCGTFIVIVVPLLKFKNYGNFLISYLFTLVPFFIVNGILTDGDFDFLFETNPVVWYNNSENLSIRIITIPIEDFFYWLLLFFMNVSFYEKFLNKLKLNS